MVSNKNVSYKRTNERTHCVQIGFRTGENIYRKKNYTRSQIAIEVKSKVKRTRQQQQQNKEHWSFGGHRNWINLKIG